MATIAELGVEVRTRGAKESTRELRELDKAAKASEASAQKLGKAWGTALGAGAAAVFVGGVTAIAKATLASELSQAKLEARVKALGPASAKSAAQVSILAESLQGLSTFDDEKIKDAASALLAFNNVKGDNFDRTMRAAVDLAADSGQDLEQVAEKLGKALNNPATASRQLRDVGIELSKSQKELVKDLLATGKGSEAQGVLLTELEHRYKGAAAAARNTMGGALKGLKNDFDNLLEGDGKGITGTTEAINQLAQTLRSDSVKDGFKVIVDGLFGTANAAIEAAAKLGSFIGTYQRFLSSSGFARAGSNTSLEDLQTRLAKLQKQSGTAAARAFGFIGDPIQDEIAQVHGLIKAFPFRGVSATVDSTELGGTWKSEVSGESTKALRDRAQATKELTEEDKKLLAVEEAFGDLVQITTQYRQDAVAAEYERATALEQSRKAIDGQIGDMQFELSLMGLSNQQREKEIALRYAGADATDAQRDSIAALSDEMFRAREATMVMEDFKLGLADAFTDFATGAKSAKDAFGDFADSLFERSVQLLTDKAINALLGAFTGGGTGSSAGSLADLFSGSGFGFADGGYTGPGGRNQIAGVVHKGEYVIDAANTRRLGVGNLDRLNSGGRPARGGGGFSQVINFAVQGRIDSRTQGQIAAELYRVGRQHSLRHA